MLFWERICNGRNFQSGTICPSAAIFRDDRRRPRCLCSTTKLGSIETTPVRRFGSLDDFGSGCWCPELPSSLDCRYFRSVARKVSESQLQPIAILGFASSKTRSDDLDLRDTVDFEVHFLKIPYPLLPKLNGRF